jgi:alpha-glucosidase
MLAGAMAFCLLQTGSSPLPIEFASPDGNVSVKCSLPTWDLSFQGRKLFLGNRVGLLLSGIGNVVEGATIEGVVTKNFDRSIKIPFGKASVARDCFSETRLQLRSQSGRSFAILFRCYPDAVAVRYELAKLAQETELRLLDETTSFRPVGNPTAFVQQLESYTTSHEHGVDELPYEEVKPNSLLDTPLTLRFDHATVAITEAALRRYAGMALRFKNGELRSDLTPRQDHARVVVKHDLVTPWRVILMGRTPGNLLESNTLYCLNDPNEIGSIRWIQPGKMTWPWWNGNVVLDGKPEPPIFSLEAQRHYIDFAKQHGIRYHSTIADNSDTPWYVQATTGVNPSESTDVTKVRSDLDLNSIKKYANSKGVKLWTWVHGHALKGRVDEAFDAFGKMGWAGMMVDFLDHDDQDTVEFAEHVLRAAARNKVLIHFHGVWKPTGLERTFPNLMNHEGALNQEYMKWGDQVTPDHTLKLMFTRMVAGPMDYHAGGFRAVKKAEFKTQYVNPLVLGTRGFMLGTYLCFDNPNPMVADSPAAYRGQVGLEFLSAVPTYWDETRVLESEIGRLLVTARRKGKTWWIGGISAGPSRNLEIPLRLLDQGTYAAKTWIDDSNSTDPNALVTSTTMTDNSSNLTVRLSEDGGFAARLVPRK